MPDRTNTTKKGFPTNTGYKGNAVARQQPYSYGGARPNVSSGYNPYGQKRQPPKAPPIQTIPLTPKEQKQLKRAQRRNKNYFFVMRRGVSFAIFVCLLLYIAAFGISFANISPVNGFVSLFTLPDNTDQEKRWEVEEEIDADGFYVVYQDTSQYISVGDPIKGFIKVITDMLMPAQQEAVADEVVAEDADQQEEDAELAEISYYNKYLKIMQERQSEFDITYTIAYYVFKFFPAAMLIAALTAVIAMLTSFGAARGRRIHKGFAVAAIIMLVAGIATLAAALMLSNVLQASWAGPLDFTNLQGLLLRAIMGPPFSAADALAQPPLQLVTGYLMWVMLIIPLVVLVLSAFCRKKVSYKIFNK